MMQDMHICVSTHYFVKDLEITLAKHMMLRSCVNKQMKMTVQVKTLTSNFGTHKNAGNNMTNCSQLATTRLNLPHKAALQSVEG